MLFNSYLFVFGFLPLALVGYEIAGRIHRKAVVAWLGLSSLAFYAWWDPNLLLILLGSIAFNYIAALLIAGSIPSAFSGRAWLYFAVTADLLLLAYYKYLFPALNGIDELLHLNRHWSNIALPLGISFFTLTQISFLVDLHKGSAERQDLSSYILFVTFFPHLIAGPILHHREMMPQFQKERFGLKKADFTVGLTWFILGLGKKVLLADSYAKTANSAFLARGHLTTEAAWLGALAYTMQLYFDFSGYSDMALGLARMFSIDFPLNFNSPSKSASVIELWQRWHMTLGRYIFTYVYHPLERGILRRRHRLGLGVARKDRSRPSVFLTVVALPLTFTLFLAGVWHGAGLQFMVFGLMHGIFLSVNHAWRMLRRRSAGDAFPVSPIHRFLPGWVRHGAAVLLTFLCYLTSLVFFRAESVGQALSVLGSMLGLGGDGAGIQPFSGPGGAIPVTQLLKVLAGLAIGWGLPNTQQILTRFHPSLDKRAWNDARVPRVLQWAPTTAWSLAVGILFFVCLVHLGDASTFLYFQF